MKYNGRGEVERIGQAGAYWYDNEDYTTCRAMSSFWINCEKDDQAFTPHLKTGGHWESWILTWFSQNVPVRSTFFDIGANVGFYSLWAASHGCREIIAFEPNPHCARAIRLASGLNGFQNITVEECALGDVAGKATLHIPQGHSGAASLTNLGVAGTERQVFVYPFDDVYHLWGRGQCYVKIDAEGSEPRIWEGMTEAWETGKMVVVLEWHHARYNAETFAHSLFTRANVSRITTEGAEQPLNKEQLLALTDLEMIVLRPKN